MSIKRILTNAAIGFGLAAGMGTAAAAGEITIATVDNTDMIVMQKLAPKWEEATGNTIDWVVLEENVLRQRTTQDIATDGGSFDIFFIGAYETPIWGANGWLTPLDDLADDADDDLEDSFQPVRNGPQDARIEISPFEIFRRQLSLVGTHSLNHNTPEALAVLEAIGPSVKNVITHQFSLEELAEVMDGHKPACSLKIQMVV